MSYFLLFLNCAFFPKRNVHNLHLTLLALHYRMQLEIIQFGSLNFLKSCVVVHILVLFENGLIDIYPDETTKPPKGYGLNKDCDITLCEIRNLPDAEQLGAVIPVSILLNICRTCQIYIRCVYYHF